MAVCCPIFEFFNFFTYFTVFYEICLFRIFSPSPWLVFSLDLLLHRAEVLNFNEVQLINYLFLGPTSGVEDTVLRE